TRFSRDWSSDVCSSDLNAFSQIMISGKVTDDENKPLVSVTVTLKGGNGGTQTDANGNYTINAPTPGSVLVFRYIGFKNQEFTVRSEERRVGKESRSQTS